MLPAELLTKYRRFSPKLVMIFGSRARGDFTDESDLDVLVVSDELPKDPREAFSLLYSEEYPRVMPLGMNTPVFLRKLKEGSTFILEVIEDGKVVMADEEFLSTVLRLFREMRGRYRREGKLWIRLS